MNNTSISVITATYNVKHTLPGLIKSLENQRDSNFKWIVADGGSTDGTIELVESIKNIDIAFSSKKDFGIYDALNSAIENCKTDYYVVIGADDEFYTNAIYDFKKSLSICQTDFVACGININGKTVWPGNQKKVWLKGQMSYVAGHAVGLAIKTNTHVKHGFYSNKFPIAADQYFILKALRDGASLSHAKFVSGNFSTDGVSSIDYLGTVTEFFRVQILVGSNKYLQMLLLFMRILKNIRRI